MLRAILLLVLALSARANLLVNPGFETWENDSTPTAWRVENRTRTRTWREQDTVRSGEASLRLERLELLSGNNFGVVQTVPVRGGAEYHYRVWAREDEPEMRLGIGLSWRRADSSYISASRVRYSNDGSEWQLIVDTLTAPAEAGLAEFRIRCYAVGTMTAPRSALVDDAWFAEPTTPAETTQVWFAEDSLGLRLMDFFNAARYSIDYCSYNSNRMDVTRSLLDAHARGVRVRVITDDTRLGNEWVLTLRAADVPVWSDSVGPGAGYYMHNKFAIRDFGNADTADDRVWCATYNANEGDLRADCALELPHTGIARAFRAEFEQMWGDTGMIPDPTRARFHRGKTDVIETHLFELDGWPVELYFAPQDRPVDTVAVRVAAARQQLLFAIFSYTHPAVGDAMIDRWDSGVWVGGVIDRSGLRQQGAQYPRLIDAGIPVYEDSVPFGEKILHIKLMVIDSLVTVVGSANWSGNGNERNDEYLFILHHPGLARRFLEQLHRRFWEATNPAVAEPGPPSRTPPPAATVVRLAALRAAPSDPVPGATGVFDATGRRVRGIDRPGVYHFVADGRTLHRLVVLH